MTTQAFVTDKTPNIPQPTVCNSELPTHPISRRQRKEHFKKTTEFRFIFATAFVFFLFTSVLERALQTRWTASPVDVTIRKPVLEQAKESASIVAGYAFMG